MVAEAVGEYLIGPAWGDPRVAEWPLMHWTYAAGISAAYVLSLPLGKAIMRNRPPMKLKRFAALHNAFLFSLSLYMSVECVRQSYRTFRWDRKFQLWCNLNDSGRTFSPDGYRLARVLWIHYLSKAYEFIDTFIMIGKKNYHQVSFLHVYHHATTFFPVWWAVVRFGPSGEAWFCCALNSAIHVFMYGYYFAATFGLKSSAVKPLITLSQMIQFLAFISQSVWLLFIKDCYRPRLSPWMLLVQCTAFFVLFAGFFRQAFLQKGRARAAKAQQNGLTQNGAEHNGIHHKSV